MEMPQIELRVMDEARRKAAPVPFPVFNLNNYRRHMVAGNLYTRGALCPEDNHGNHEIDAGLPLLALDRTTPKEGAEKPFTTQAVVSFWVA